MLTRQLLFGAAVALVFVSGSSHAFEALSPTEVFRQAAQSVAVVEVVRSDGTLMQGSAVVVASEKLVTNCHVVRSARRISVKHGDSNFAARLTHSDTPRDLCQLDAPGLDAKPARFRSAASLEVGERVYAIGAPRGFELSLSEGLVSSLRAVSGGSMIQTSAAISPGSSGGGLFDAQAKLVGITTLYVTESQSLNFAVPSDWIADISSRAEIQSASSEVSAQLQERIGAQKESLNRLEAQLIEAIPEYPELRAAFLERILSEGVPKLPPEQWRDASLRVFSQLVADQGSASAKHSVGRMHEDGTVFQQDLQLAAMWYRNAADEGFADAQHDLGLMYASGRGVAKDDQHAVSWFRKAADQGSAFAQGSLAAMYSSGRGVAKDDRQAATWYRRSAEQGNARSQSILGWKYQTGVGVPKDYQQAIAWYRRAAEQGEPDAQFQLGAMYADGLGVPRDDQQAVAWYRKAADQGDALAQNYLGAMYAIGRGVPKDDQQAFIWYSGAAVQGQANAQVNLGLIYANGLGVQKDEQQAADWYRKAADQGDALAQGLLGAAYADGRGVPKDERQAMFWLQKAADQGSAVAQFGIGVMYANGRGVPKDDQQALAWYRKAAQQGEVNAQNNLGRMHADGHGVPKNDQTAYFWFLLASAQGDTTAARNLEIIERRLTPQQRAAAQAEARDWKPASQQ